MVDSTTYSMANITSVSTKVVTPSRTVYIVLILLGLFLILYGFGTISGGGLGFTGVVFGGVLTAVGYFGYQGAKPVFHLCIVSASGESTPMHSGDQAKISNIVKAMNDAIVHRA